MKKKSRNIPYLYGVILLFSYICAESLNGIHRIMQNNLVIVESPAKAKTIEKFLGKGYKVLSSYGHIRDLQQRTFSIDIKNHFTPIYEVPEDKKKLVSELKKEAHKADMVWLASDEDREGEAIAWHLSEVLELDPATTRRIVFHEITKDAILRAIANPRTIDLNRVNAQQARRVLDRIVGFEVSPVLWKKIKPALSAGRVQSVAVRLIVERENEIKNFVSEEYYRVSAIFTTASGKQVKAELHKRLSSREQAEELLEKLRDTTFTVEDINVKPIKKSPAAPFTTSTLQQEASRKLGFTVSQTMVVAQKLYEAGYITYMRTDSLNLSSLAINTISNEITENQGAEYLKVRRYHTTSRGAQEAHEAIRPTYIDRHTIEGSAQEKKLYSLIWKRTIASQMADAILEKTTVDITPASAPDARFMASGEVIKFDGFLKVYLEGTDDEPTGADDSQMLPDISKGEHLKSAEITATERFTQQPPRYTEASLVKKMEELGIGRPSTYAPTISTIQQREYVEKGERPGKKRKITVLTLADGKITESTPTESYGAEKGKLLPTDTGMVVNDFLVDYFPNVLDYNFTANVEERFDDIAEGKSKWNDEIASFYEVFHPEVTKANDVRLEHRVGERSLGNDPATGRPVVVKVGRFGPIVQIGEGNADERPQFAKLDKGQSIYTITLEEALKLFALPRSLGEFEGKEVTVASGRFGPYVKHDGKFVSIPKDMSPTSITLEECEELILAKRENDLRKVVKKFDEDPDLQILNGRYGVYIAYKKKNYKIPKSVTNPTALSVDDCHKLIEQQDAAPAKPKRTTTRKKTS